MGYKGVLNTRTCCPDVQLWFSLLLVIDVSFGAVHYENTPMQYTAIFHGCKNDNFQMKKVDNFLIFTKNIDRGYTLEPPQ